MKLLLASGANNRGSDFQIIKENPEKVYGIEKTGGAAWSKAFNCYPTLKRDAISDSMDFQKIPDIMDYEVIVSAAGWNDGNDLRRKKTTAAAKSKTIKKGPSTGGTGAPSLQTKILVIFLIRTYFSPRAAFLEKFMAAVEKRRSRLGSCLI
jgi:hypothetical protein